MHNPQTQGVYIENKEGVVIARTVLVRDDAKGPYTKASYTYGTSSGQSAMSLILANMQIKQPTSGGNVLLSSTVKFKVPGVKMSPWGIMCPSCALDIYNSDLFYGWQEDETKGGVFIFSPTRTTLTKYKLSNIYNSGQGYIQCPN